MPQDDIYGSKAKYERFIAHLEEVLVDPKERPNSRGRGIYFCKNKDNLKYFRQLINHFDARDISYIRRRRVFDVLKLITFVCEKDLAASDRNDINQIMAYVNRTYATVTGKTDFVKDIKCIWKVLFPEKDSQGRVDEAITPYLVRHLSRTVDRSQHKMRNDRYTPDEFMQLVTFFAADLRTQCFVTLAHESLARPQELLYLKIKDIELQDCYAKITVSEHGKEGPGILQCVDSFPYLLRWLGSHPLRHDPAAFLFVNLGDKNFGTQMKPQHMLHLIKQACHNLHIKKSITSYSLKRNGITFRRLSGESDMEIQHSARWTSTKPLKVYDQSDQRDALIKRLVRKGLSKAPTEQYKQYEPETKKCIYCGQVNAFTDTECKICKRLLDRRAILKQEQDQKGTLSRLQEEMQELRDTLSEVKSHDADLVRLLNDPEVKRIFLEQLMLKTSNATQNYAH
jgi:integrase